MSKKLPTQAVAVMYEAQRLWTLALAEPSRKGRTKALRQIVIEQALELDRLRVEAKELEDAYDSHEPPWTGEPP